MREVVWGWEVVKEIPNMDILGKSTFILVVLVFKKKCSIKKISH